MPAHQDDASCIMCDYGAPYIMMTQETGRRKFISREILSQSSVEATAVQTIPGERGDSRNFSMMDIERAKDRICCLSIVGTTVNTTENERLGPTWVRRIVT